MMTSLLAWVLTYNLCCRNYKHKLWIVCFTARFHSKSEFDWFLQNQSTFQSCDWFWWNHSLQWSHLQVILLCLIEISTSFDILNRLQEEAIQCFTEKCLSGNSGSAKLVKGLFKTPCNNNNNNKKRNIVAAILGTISVIIIVLILSFALYWG